MLDNQTPQWLQKAERKIAWLAIPNLAVTLVGLQVIGFILVMSNPAWYPRLMLQPQLVLEGEVWRLVTFLCLPLTTSLLWLIFVLWFLFLSCNA